MLAGPWVDYLTRRFGAVTRPTEQLDADPVGIRLAPVVNTAADAVRTFRSIGLDSLVLGSHLVEPGK